MSNDELLASLLEAVRSEGAAIARVVALLIKVENRRLHLDLAYPTMFEFCRSHLGFSEDEAYRRKETALLARRFPQILDALEARRIHMTALLLLREVLTDANVDDVLAAASGKTKREVQLLIARRVPHPDVPSSIRKLPDPRGALVGHPVDNVTVMATLAGSPAAPTEMPVLLGYTHAPIAASELRSETTNAIAGVATTVGKQPVPPRIRPSAQIEPLSATRHRVQFTVNAKQLERLERARVLTRHGNIEGDLAILVDQAIVLLIAKREKEKLAATTRPRAKGSQKAVAQSESASAVVSSRTTGAASKPAAVPAATKREVTRRDGEQCSFVSSSGERCAARELLELDHRHPRALGGSNEASNLRLLCRVHNQLAAERVFGREHVARSVASRRSKGASTTTSLSVAEGETVAEGKTVAEPELERASEPESKPEPMRARADEPEPVHAPRPGQSRWQQPDLPFA